MTIGQCDQNTALWAHASNKIANWLCVVLLVCTCWFCSRTMSVCVCVLGPINHFSPTNCVINEQTVFRNYVEMWHGQQTIGRTPQSYYRVRVRLFRNKHKHFIGDAFIDAFGIIKCSQMWCYSNVSPFLSLSLARSLFAIGLHAHFILIFVVVGWNEVST